MKSIMCYWALLGVILLSCSSRALVDSEAMVAPTATPAVVPTKPPQTQQNLTKLPDFENFDYPVCFQSIKKLVPRLRKLAIRKKELRIPENEIVGGEEALAVEVVNVSARDLNGDGIEEALVTLRLQFFQGSEWAVLLFDIRRKPRVIWSREFGDAAFGAPRKIRFTNDGLFIEEYNGGSSRNTPTSFLTTHYRLFKGKIVKLDSFETTVDLNHVEYLGFPNDFSNEPE